MTQQTGAMRRLRANLARSRRVWGGEHQQAVLWFDRKEKSMKCASVYTLALLATL